jgi:MFS transporter, DHA3 family, macrolide efflux protein
VKQALASDPPQSRSHLAAWARFAALWAPQTFALTARGLTTFAVGVWLYEKTHSATLYSFLSVSTMLPGVLAAPLVGWSVDRLGARRALLLADAAAVVVGLSLILMFRGSLTSPLLLYLVLSFGALLTAAQWPAYTALVSVVAPPKQLSRAAALMQVGFAGQQVIAPVLAGVLLGIVGVAGIVGLDVAMSVVALGSLFSMSIGVRPEPVAARTSIARDLRAALALTRERGLLRLALYIICSYLPGGFVLVLATPLVLTIAGPQTLGVVMSVMGTGMLVGSVVASTQAVARGGVRRLLRYDALLALAMLSASFATTAGRVSVIGFVFLFGLGGVMAEEQAVWQVRIPIAAQGRVFALRRALTWASLPLSYALAGPLADHVFKPAMSPGGALAPVLGPVFGVGPGRGIALLLVCGGLMKGSVVLWGTFDRKLRALDVPPPDAADS